jgi:hypothetical protein
MTNGSPEPTLIVPPARDGHRRRCAGISSGMAPKFLLAVPAQPSNRAARERAL